jgi:hypothetical protein
LPASIEVIVGALALWATRMLERDGSTWVAVSEVFVKALPARSAMTPPLSERVEESVMPSVSISDVEEAIR